MEGFHFAIQIDLPAPGWDDVPLNSVSLADFDEDFEGTCLARDVTVRDVLGQIEAAEGLRVEVARSAERVSATGYIAGWHEYCLWVEGLLFLLGAARAVGASGRGALFADDGAGAEYPIYQLYSLSKGRLTVDKRDCESDGEELAKEVLAKHGLALK